jgi:hypothetical protein
MSRLVDLDSASLWEQRYVTHKYGAARPTGRGFVPIAPFKIPLLLESPIVAVRASSEDGGKDWKLACWCDRIIPTSSPVAAIAQISADRNPLGMNKTTLLDYTANPVENYQLQLEPPYWMPDLRVEVWEFVGAIGDTLADDLDVARVDLVRIEAKIDALFAAL